MGSNQQKLRATCNRCTLLKCVYTPYRWKGRPAHPKTPVQQVPSTSAAEGSYSGLPAANIHTHSETLRASHPGRDNLQANQQRAVPTCVSPITGWDPQGQADLDNFVNMFGMDLEMLGGVENSPSEGRTESSSEFEQRPPSRFTFTVMGPPPRLDYYDCYQIMLGLLEGLSQLNPGCESARVRLVPGASCHNHPGRFSSNDLMKSNRTALQHLDFLLSRSCRDTCLSRLDSSYLLHSICLTILARYQDIFESLAQNPLRSMPPTPPFLSDRSVSRTGAVFFDPVQFKDFPLDRQAEMRINAELLLCELGAFSSLALGVDDIEPKHQREQETGDETGEPQARHHSTRGSRPAFEEHLRQKIDELRKLTKEFRDTLV
ncbi:hypothetical protein F5Y13DRAFT_116814 [Hypoxylon sp. FL1857]|nr:hypothetical protein F5Y13DRAFT_116814 [Hypoxylon sp. FL1857]